MSVKQCQCCGGTGWEGSDCAEHRWIPVEKRLPEEGVNVLVAQLNGFFNVDLRRRDTKQWSTGAKITHWMPLPLPPEKKVQV